ncbi:hypothetical protein R3W88_012278 [Solanum pinnatisectum]|uniref:Neprosin PEP catalytic domain-containing protein n=1 Tax=Solanum pinnatisectum TaxID=50273 RepID=A0AAV9LC71_9SOLN|nr:hypothetical protein R3W88_012278 [Solanum pinnatisectum]
MALIFTTLCFIILVWTTIAFCLVEGYGSSRHANLVLETIHGDIYDCVDVYKQPTLLHPMPHKERIKVQDLYSYNLIDFFFFSFDKQNLITHNSVVLPIDYAFPKISRPMYDDYELLIQIYKDEDYYLLFEGLFVIGFWPETIFNELRNGSQVVRYGGQAFTPAGEQYSPPMGNGNFEDGNPHTTCHMRQVLYGVGYNQLVQPDESLVQTHQSRCYHEGSQHNAHDDYWDYNFLFGGGGFC